jgi:hypothetical protein
MLRSLGMLQALAMRLTSWLFFSNGRRLSYAPALFLAAGFVVASPAVALADGALTCDHGHDRFGSATGPYGFGLSWHLGYGYGGRRLGVGPYGGYPFYGGPGYLVLGPANAFRGVGPPVVNRGVVDLGDRRDTGASEGYGPFSGALPYPESLFAPFASASATNKPPAAAAPPTGPLIPAPDRGPGAD